MYFDICIAYYPKVMHSDCSERNVKEMRSNGNKLGGGTEDPSSLNNEL